MRSMVLYFAYGSNMNPARMAKRCPGAITLGRAKLPHYRLAERLYTEFSDRVLYGCDICNEKSTYQYEFAEFLDGLAADGSISEATYRKVLRENAMTLFQL